MQKAGLPAIRQVYLQAELVQAGENIPPGLEVAIPEGKPGGALGTVLERSRLLCLKQYHKPQHDDDSWLAQLTHTKDYHLLDSRQLAVYAREPPSPPPPLSPFDVWSKDQSSSQYLLQL